ncbi:MAG: phosphate ABC transporter permease PstA [Actinomycetia bacterium]|nr:phosphate ABC transporter permease PstA [Actinomycetes bacterium]
MSKIDAGAGSQAGAQAAAGAGAAGSQKGARATSRTSAKVIDRIATGVFYVVAAFFILLLASITAYILYKGALAASPELLSFVGDGVGIQLFNTVYLVFLSLLVTMPVGIMTGLFMAEYAGSGFFVAITRTCIEALSSLPSIIVGLFGFLVFIQMTHSKWSLWAGSLSLAIINVPLIARTTEDAMRSVPRSYYDGSIALGASRWQTVTHVLLKASIPRIITGMILAAGRGFGEAAVLLYTSGMSSDVNFHDWNPLSPTSPLNPLRSADTLSVRIWSLKTEGIAANSQQIADLAAAILILLVFVFSLGSRALGRRLQKRMLSGN